MIYRVIYYFKKIYSPEVSTQTIPKHMKAVKADSNFQVSQSQTIQLFCLYGNRGQ